ncbi:MAG: hypothetical protein KJ067_21905 [Vicinamibacteria bacterium]|nr:hypothetical protein [Vicinamibacteria bacterium]
MAAKKKARRASRKRVLELLEANTRLFLEGQEALLRRIDASFDAILHP